MSKMSENVSKLIYCSGVETNVMDFTKYTGSKGPIPVERAVLVEGESNGIPISVLRDNGCTTNLVSGCTYDCFGGCVELFDCKIELLSAKDGK